MKHRHHALAGTFLSLASAWSLAGCAIDDEAVPEDELEVGVSELGGSNATQVPDGTYEAVGTTGGCSGTLISDDLVVLAAHCVCTWDPVVACKMTENFALPNVRPVDDPSTDVDESATRTLVTFVGATVVAHPDFNIGAWLANDVALLRLPQPASTRAIVSPMSLSWSYPSAGRDVTLVGMGKTDGPDGNCTVSDAIKRSLPTRISAVTSNGIGGLTLGITDRFGHVCVGDSGGPMLDTSNRVIGVASFGDFVTNSAYASIYPVRRWLEQQVESPGNRIGVFDLDGAPAASAYNDPTADPAGLLGWKDGNDIRLAGDFMNLGHDQLFFINRGGAGGRVRIADYADAVSPTDSLYWEAWGDSTLLNGWHDSTDAQLVGDFLGRGYDQVMFVNRSGTGGRVMVVDYHTGVPSIGYFESYGQFVHLNGWTDATDGLLAGDFRGLGHDQVMFVNRGGSGGRVLIASFATGVGPAAWQYVEYYSDLGYLSGWIDSDDLMVAGDFRDTGHDQVLFVNRASSGGRFLITDFSDGWFPAEWQYIESYNQTFALDGFHGSDDFTAAGDFGGLGYDQVLFVNRTTGAPNILAVADFRDGALPAEFPYYQNSNQISPVRSRIGSNDLMSVGDFTGAGHTQLLTIETY